METEETKETEPKESAEQKSPQMNLDVNAVGDHVQLLAERIGDAESRLVVKLSPTLARNFGYLLLARAEYAQAYIEAHPAKVPQ